MTRPPQHTPDDEETLGPETLDDETLEDAVRAMGHPGRRAMLTCARDRERTATELAEAAGLTPSAASQHLKLLRQTGLMVVRVDARRRLYHVDLARLAQVRAVLDSVWADRLDALAALAEADHQQEASAYRRTDDAGLAG